jgi:hypothetical protein
MTVFFLIDVFKVTSQSRLQKPGKMPQTKQTMPKELETYLFALSFIRRRSEMISDKNISEKSMVIGLFTIVTAA